MDCGENSKQNLWYLTLYCCILSQNALIPAFLAHKKCGDDAKTTTWCIFPAFPGPTHSVRLGRAGGGGGAHSLFHHSQHSDTSHKYNLQVPVSFLQQYYNKSEERVPTYKLDNTSGKKATHQVPQHNARISTHQHVCFLISVEGASRIDRHGTHFHHRHFQHNNYDRSECLILFFSFERRSFSHICLLDYVSEVSLSPCFLTGNGRKRKENTTNSLIVSIFSNMTRSRFYF